ncbi:MAG: SH3 domain-containing protein [Clostridia bacterium]|nr:SH3 domain-containing protein [Clostridia bacterium]
MFKRIVAVILFALLTVTFCSCKKETASTPSGSVSDNNSTTANVTPDNSSSIEIDEVEYDPQNKNNSDFSGQPYEVGEFTPQNIKAKGIDVSKWQGRIDWNRVAKAGVDFAIIRIGYRGENGKIYKDENADYNIQQAQKSGILVGVYFFSTAISAIEAKEEASWTASQIKGYSISYPVVFDCEGFTDSDSRMFKLSKTQRTDNAMTFLSEVKALGYEAMFYASKNGLEGNEWDTERIEKSYKIWVAQYSLNKSEPEKLTYRGRCDMWQYTNSGKIDGIETAVDLNVSYFKPKKVSPKDSSAAPNDAEPPKTFAEMQYTEVNEQVTAKDTVYLREGPSASYKSVGTLKNGDVLTRIAVGKNGWSKLLFGGSTVYAVSSYLTTDLSYKTPNTDIVEGNVFTPKTDEVTAKDTVNLREKPTTDSAVVGVINNGEFLKRTAVSDKGWSRLTYQGKTVYAVTSYLTTERQQASSMPAEEMVFRSANEQVTAKVEANLRDKPTTEGSNVVGILKNGEFVKRTGISDKGWSRLEYNGKTVYAVSSYLTLDADNTGTDEMIFRDADGEVTAKTETNLRDKPTTDGSEVVYLLKNGEFLKRTGISDKGWSRLEYDGKTVYAVSSYLEEK